MTYPQLAGSVHQQHHQKEVAAWVTERRDAVGDVPSVFTRQLMRLLMKKMGHPTDTSHDYDYTDWDAVDRLGRELAESVKTAHAAPA
ncbi:MAG TPA: hypothetical protein VGR11_15090 [Solirubrobacteraceae bacterium]|nr:hypothetical protein [Solirubrobacteraceae bacterium]